MRSIVMMLAAVVSMTACAPEVGGSFSGETSACENPDFDGVPVTILVDVASSTAAMTTSLGLPTDRATSFTQSGGDLDDPAVLSFATTFVLDDDDSEVDYTIDLAASDNGESHSGTIDVVVVVDGGDASRCQLTVTR